MCNPQKSILDESAFYGGYQLAGKVTELTDSGFTLQYIGTSSDGREFPDDLQVHLNDVPKKKIKTGDWISVMGYPDLHPGPKTVLIGDASTVKKVPAQTFKNLAQLKGEVTWQMITPSEGGRWIGNAQIQVGPGRRFSAAFFGSLVRIMQLRGGPGAIVDFIGRLENRERPDGDKMIRLVADNNWSKILQPATRPDLAMAYTPVVPTKTEEEITALSTNNNQSMDDVIPPPGDDDVPM